jgi:hypothetical protein
LNAVGGKGGAQEYSGEQIPRRIALQLQADLDDYQAVNPDFPVSCGVRVDDHLGEVMLKNAYAGPAIIESSTEIGSVRC